MRHNIILHLILMGVLCTSCSKPQRRYDNIKEHLNIEYIKENRQYPEVFIDLQYFEPIALCTGSRSVNINNDTINEVYPTLMLINETDSTYLVLVSNPLNEDIMACGYICKSTPLRIFARKYRPDLDPLIIYSTPDLNSKSMKSYQQYDQLEVIGFKDSWLKIKLEVDGNIVEGWLPKEEQCANAYSTCS